MKSTIYLVVLFHFAFLINVNAQNEVLTPLLENNALFNVVKKEQTSKKALKLSKVNALTLPFFDDFYPNNIFPNSAFWEDSNVYINNHYPINPISQGVATFDGLDKIGLPYSNNPNALGIADFLTSKTIDLSSLNAGSNVYLSFYYQPKGHGQAPENEDKLIVEFLHPTDGWTQVWISPNLDALMSETFTKVFLSVEEVYLTDGFKFRFKNSVRLSGNNDHWHIDYVELDKGRNPVIEQKIPDVSFQNAIGGVLKRYSTMPYSLIDSSEIADSLRVVVKNNFPLSAVDITDKYTARLTSPNVPHLNYSGNLDFLASEEQKIYKYPMFSFPFNLPNDTVNLEILYQFKVSLEDSLNPIIIRNNNLLVKQQFGNYFAYDDGSPERAYQFEYGNSSEGSISVQYFTPKPTKLRGIRFHVANYNTLINNAQFSIKVWKKIGKAAGNEDELIYEQNELKISQFSKEFGNSLNDYFVYAISKNNILSGDSVLEVSDSFYIGMTFFKVTNEEFSLLPIGFDVNNNSKSNNFYKTTQNNVWIPSSFDGSLILNPIVGKKLKEEFITPIFTNETQELILYPNPAVDKIRIADTGNGAIQKAIIYTIDGRVAGEQLLYIDGLMDISALPQGYYFIEFYDQYSNIYARSRFVKVKG